MTKIKREKERKKNPLKKKKKNHLKRAGRITPGAYTGLGVVCVLISWMGKTLYYTGEDTHKGNASEKKIPR